ncbi:hypothetical protein ACPA54_20810 [Uniformispora flossi]|uniref:hypothetical protein n=1 Tax=Uniformispora flossi TaxID=3390723 RepID=UPI003C2AB178
MRWTQRRPPLDAAAPVLADVLGRIIAVRAHELALRQAGSGPDGVPLLVPPPAGRDPAALMAAYAQHLEHERDGVLTKAIGAVTDTVVKKTLHYLHGSPLREPSMRDATRDVAGRVTAAASGRSSDAGAQPGPPPATSHDHTWAAAEIDAKSGKLGRRPADREQVHALNLAVEFGGRAAAAQGHAEIRQAQGDTVKEPRSAVHSRRNLAEAVHHAGLAAQMGQREVRRYAAWLAAPDGARPVIDPTREQVGEAVARLDRVAAGLASATDMKAKRSPVAADVVNGSAQEFTVARAFATAHAVAAELVPEPGRSLAG